jgi:hypothetical protein
MTLLEYHYFIILASVWATNSIRHSTSCCQRYHTRHYLSTAPAGFDDYIQGLLTYMIPYATLDILKDQPCFQYTNVALR